jgi:hypothetical protein
MLIMPDKSSFDVPEIFFIAIDQKIWFHNERPDEFSKG